MTNTPEDISRNSDAASDPTQATSPKFDPPYSTDDLYKDGDVSLDEMFAATLTPPADNTGGQPGPQASDAADSAAPSESDQSSNAGAPMGSAGSGTEPPVPPLTRKRQLPWVWIAAAVVVLLGIGAAALAVNSRGADPDAVAEGTTSGNTGTTDASGKKPDAGTGTAEQGSKDKEPQKHAPLVLPECAELNAFAQAKTDEVLARGLEVNNGEAPFGTNNKDVLIGDATRAALDKTTQTRACQYAFSMESGTREIVSELPKDAGDEFIATLKADPDISEVSIGSSSYFTWSEYSETGHNPYQYTTHLFLQDAWVIILTDNEPEAQVQAAYDGLVATNPGIAG